MIINYNIKNDITTSYFFTQNLDIRIKKNNPRFLDQKCTPDVLTFIAECVLQINQDEFTSKDILLSGYFITTLLIIFGKPNPKNKSQNEYDKFVSQPLDLLSYANVLKKYKKNGKNKFKILNRNILEYIALKDRNAYYFLCDYLIRFSIDSGFQGYFQNFLDKQDPESFQILKDKFNYLVISNSDIGNKGSNIKNNTEIRRIFPKYLNILSLYYGVKGSIKGRFSKYNITYTNLVYNKENFRDLDKAKNISRQDSKNSTTQDYNKHSIEKAKKWVKQQHKYSEIQDDLYGKTSHVHHIFPQSEFLSIAHCVENLIALTAGQHQDKAHPNGNNAIVDKMYQMICLLAKSKTIKKFEEQGLSIYSRLKFIEVLNIGFGLENNKISFDSDFEEINKKIHLFYKIGL